MISRFLVAMLFISCLSVSAPPAQAYDGLIAAPPASGSAVPKDGYGGVVSWGDAPADSQYTSQDIYGYVQKGGAQTYQDDKIAKLKEGLAKRRAAMREQNRTKNLQRQTLQRKEAEQQQKKDETAANRGQR